MHFALWRFLADERRLVRDSQLLKNFFERQSVAQEKKPKATRKKGRRRIAGQGEMLLPYPWSEEQGKSKVCYSGGREAKEGWVNLCDRLKLRFHSRRGCQP